MAMRHIVVLAALLAVIYAQTVVTNEQTTPEKALITPAAPSDLGTESSEVAGTQTRNKRAPIIGKALLGGALLGAGALGAGALGAGLLGAGALGAAGLYKAKYLAGGYGYGYGYGYGHSYPYPYHYHNHYHNYPSYHSHYHSYPSYYYSFPQYHHHSYGPAYW